MIKEKQHIPTELRPLVIRLKTLAKLEKEGLASNAIAQVENLVQKLVARGS